MVTKILNQRIEESKNRKIPILLLATIFSLGAFATDFTLKSSLSGQDFDWSLGSNYEGDPAEGPQANDKIIIPENTTAIVSKAAADSSGTCGICDIYVSEGATLQILDGAGDTKARQSPTYVRTITGPGTVAQVGTLTEDLYIRKSCAFDGKFTGLINYIIMKDVTFRLNNADQNYTGSMLFRDTSTMEIARINPASGTGHFYGTGGNFNNASDTTVRYIGEEGLKETLNRTFYNGASTTIDTGLYGGLTVTSYMKNSCTYQMLVTLTGDNAEESVFNAYNLKYVETAKDKPNPLYIIKEGTGTWQFKKNKNNYPTGWGVIDVRNGTVKFSDYAEAGVNCDLGFGLQLYKAGWALATNEANKVDYALMLGGVDSATEGVLRYTGTADIDFTTRKLAVRSKGKLVADTANVTLNGVTGEGDGDKTFTLSTAADTVSTGEHIDDGSGSGSLSLVKEGTGTLSLSGTNSFSGKLVSKGGLIKLRTDVDPNVHYSWFRFTVKENGYGCPEYDTTYSVGQEEGGEAKTITDSEKSFVQISEIALYDANGAVISAGICQHDAASKSFAGDFFSAADGYQGLEPGYAGLDSSVGTAVANAANLALGALFDSDNTAMSARFDNAATGHGVDGDDPTTWVPIVFRLPATVTENAAYFDIAPGRNREGVASYNGRNPISYRLEMSTDGVNWINCFDDQTIEVPETFPRWVSDTSTWASYGPRQGKGVAVEHIDEWQLFPKDAQFTWFRFTIKENGYGCSSYDTTYSVGENSDGTPKTITNTERGYIQIDEIALYDADGNNLTGKNIQQNSTTEKLTEDIFTAASGYQGLKAGYVGLDSSIGSVAASENGLVALFNGATKELKLKCTKSENSKGINLDDPTTWVPIVFRLPEGSAPAAYFDLAPGRNRYYYGSSTTVFAGSYNGRNVKSFRLEGSPDGVHWFKLLDDQDDIAIPEYHPHWFTEPEATMTFGARKTGKLKFLDREGPTDLLKFTGVEVSNGASITLTGDSAPAITSLGLDATSLPGTLSGLNLADSGVLDVANVGTGRFSFSGLLSNFKNAANIQNWTLKLDGATTTRKLRVADDGTVTIGPAKSGAIMTIK